MSALPDDVMRATRSARIVVRTDTAIRAAYPAARDGVQSPEPGYFVTAADAETVLTDKADLIGTQRRRFRVDIAGEVWIDPLSGVPSYQLVASELDADLPVMLCRVEVDTENETTTFEVMG